MKPFSTALGTLFDTNTFVSADLISFTLTGGGTANITSADQNVVWDGVTYLSGTPRMERSSISQKTGLQVSSVKITVYPTENDMIGGTTWLSALRRGLFDGASVTISRGFAPNWTSPITGAIIMMAGRVADATFGRSKAEIEVNSWTELLSNQMPRTYYQSSCNNTFGDARCGINVNALGMTGSVVETINASELIASALPLAPANVLAYGRLKMTSGVCAGEVRPISANSDPDSTGTTINMQIPFSVTPAPGDTLIAYPGCDKTINTCQFRWNNVINFTGMPFIPAPETAV